MAAFDSDFRLFQDASALASYLSSFPAPIWPAGRPVGTTVHNTYRPDESMWAGYASLESMRKDYMSKSPPWTSGPHFYLASGTAHDGIWMMTPPVRPGTHAGECNPRRFGVEVVGDFEARPVDPSQRALLLSVLVVLHRWAKIGADVVGHRDCMANRTCPGRYAYEALPALRQDLAARLAQSTEEQLAQLWGPDFAYHPDWGIPRAWAPKAAELGAAISGEDYNARSAIVLQRFAGGLVLFNKTTGKAATVIYRQIGL